MSTPHNAVTTAGADGLRALCRIVPLLLACLLSATGTVCGDDAAGKADEKPANRPAEKFQVETSDGWIVPLWYYAPAAGVKRPPAIMLVHDLGGSHESVHMLAEALRSSGCAVAAPDLRGHGQSLSPKSRPDSKRSDGRPRADVGPRKDKSEPWETFKQSDLEMMAASGGGQKRDQAAIRGDLESVRTWLEQRSESGECDVSRLVVVGSGVGATVAAVWTAHDWAWPDLPAEQQGRLVRGLVLISPARTYKGFAFPATSDALQTEVPVMLLAGRKDEEALKLFQRLKPHRSKAWFEQRAGAPAPNRAEELAKTKDAVATLLLLQFDTASSGDALAAYRAAAGGTAVDPATLIKGFVTTLPPPQR